MWICNRCGEIFDEPDSVEFCYEEYYGVSSMFPNKNYGHYDACPNCGSEDIEDHYESEDEEWTD